MPLETSRCALLPESLPLHGHTRRLQLGVGVPELDRELDDGRAVLLEIEIGHFAQVCARNHLLGSEGVDDFRWAADGNVYRAWHGAATGHADDFDRAVFEFGFTHPTRHGDADVGRCRADVARSNGSRVDGDSAAVHAGAQPRNVERRKSSKLHHLHDTDGAAHGELGGIDIRLPLDHVAFGGLSGDGGLQWDLTGDDIFPLQLDARRIDDGDGRFGREREGFGLETDRLTVTIAKIDLDRHDARLDLAIDGARWTAQG